jgi:4-oxalocrotonate tautomerase
MPHIIVKLYPGRSAEQKAELTERIVESVVQVTQCERRVVSVAFEEVPQDQWLAQVYQPDIMNRQDQLTQKPGYGPLLNDE